MTLVAGYAHAPFGLADRTRPVADVAHDLLELEPSRILVVAQDLDDIGGRLIAEVEPVGEAGCTGPGSAVTGDGHHHARGGKVVWMG